jgi:hypothetical protein
MCFVASYGNPTRLCICNRDFVTVYTEPGNSSLGTKLLVQGFRDADFVNQCDLVSIHPRLHLFVTNHAHPERLLRLGLSCFPLRVVASVRVLRQRG